MSITIPAIKLPPGMVFGMLQVIDKHLENPERMAKSMVDYYRSVSVRVKPPSEKNIRRAVTLPSLRHLELIEGIWPRIRLTANSRQILSNLMASEVGGAKRTLGRVLYGIDQRKAHVISTLEQKGGTLERDSLLKAMATRFDVHSEEGRRESDDRVGKWLGYLTHFELVRSNSGITLNSSLIEAFRSGYRLELSKQEFVKTLIAKYKELSGRASNQGYVPLPLVRDAVCAEFKGMLAEDFYRNLMSIEHNTEQYSILLSEPMTRQEGGLRVGDKYYYYMAIFERKG